MIIKVELYVTKDEIQLAFAYLAMNGIRANLDECGPIPKGEKYHPEFKVVGNKQILHVTTDVNNILVDNDIPL